VYRKEELEDLLGVIYRDDDITVLLYNALKDSPNKKNLLRYRRLCLDAELERGLDSIVTGHKAVNTTSKKNDIRSSFADMLGRRLP